MPFSTLAAAFRRRRQDAPSQKMGARQRSQAIRQRIEAEAAANRARGVVPVGILIDEKEVDPWHTVGSTGVSIIDPNEVGDPLDKDDVDLFLSGEMAIMVDSSNVEFLKYLPQEKHLLVGFKAKKDWPRSVYGYAPISRDEAMSAAVASSKGVWVWDELRIRGTVYGHQKAYWRIS